MTITRLADTVKQGAASLGSEQPEAQVKQSRLEDHFYMYNLHSMSLIFTFIFILFLYFLNRDRLF